MKAMYILRCRHSIRQCRQKGPEEYLYDDKALEKYRKTHKPGSFTLQRYKGLGEMDAEQLWETTLNPETTKNETRGDRRCTSGIQCDRSC